MTNYNDGKWHGWNGGECPIHPESLVEAVFLDDTNPGRPYDSLNSLNGREMEAKTGDRCWTWSPIHRKIIAFRVVKEYREPREWWLTKCGSYTHAHETLEAAQNYERCNRNVEIIHVREVVEGGAQ